jgi:hypothetical protein
MAGLILLTAPYPLLLSLAPAWWALAVAATAYGATLSMAGNIYVVVLQTQIPNRFLGRVLAIVDPDPSA